MNLLSKNKNYLVKARFLFFASLLCFIVSGCTSSNADPTTLYNKKANEIIVQLLKDQECNCMMQIPKESLIEISLTERPYYDIRSLAIKKLKLRNSAELDSMVSQSRKFELDTLALKKNGIKIISLENIMATETNNNSNLFKLCLGVLFLSKSQFLTAPLKKPFWIMAWYIRVL